MVATIIRVFLIAPSIPHSLSHGKHKRDGCQYTYESPTFVKMSAMRDFFHHALLFHKRSIRKHVTGRENAR